MATNNSTATSEELTEQLINGIDPLTAFGIECTTNIIYEQARAMSAMFRTIQRLSTDKDIIDLCEHGTLQAELQANDIDGMNEVVR